MGAAAGARRLVVQRRVRSLVIVLFAPFVQLLSRFTHAPELDSTQYLVAHRPVVALYHIRLAVQTYQPVQRLRNIVAAEASRHLATQAFTTVVVYHVQYPIALLFSNTSYIKSILHLSFISFGCPLFTRSNRRSLRRVRLPICRCS